MNKENFNKNNIKKLSDKELLEYMIAPYTTAEYFSLLKQEYERRPKEIDIVNLPKYVTVKELEINDAVEPITFNFGVHL